MDPQEWQERYDAARKLIVPLPQRRYVHDGRRWRLRRPCTWERLSFSAYRWARRWARARRFVIVSVISTAHWGRRGRGTARISWRARDESEDPERLAWWREREAQWAAEDRAKGPPARVVGPRELARRRAWWVRYRRREGLSLADAPPLVHWTERPA